MPSTPSRLEVEHLHRLMMQASLEAADLDRKVWDAQQRDGLSRILKGWHEPAVAIQSAFLRSEAGLLADNAPKALIDRIESRFDDLRDRSTRFDPFQDLRACVEQWKSLGAEFARLSGQNRNGLLALLERFKPKIDETTSLLSATLTTEGLVVENYRILVRLREERDKARDKYERLRQKYLQAEQDWISWERQKAQAEREQRPQEHHARHAPVPPVVPPKHGPAVVRLPEQKKPVERPMPQRPVEHQVKPAGSRKTVPHKPVPQHHKPPPVHHAPAPHKPPPHTPIVIKPGRHAPPRQAHPAAVKPGPLRISLERIERVGSYPTAADGIGRGALSAHIWFKAENFDHALQVQGTAGIALGCGVRLEVAPSVQLYSSVPGQPVRGQISLGLASSGGRLLGLPPRVAIDNAKQAAKNAAPLVASKLGIFGKHLASAIAQVIEDAAEKIFSRAQPGHHPAGTVPHHHGHQPHAVQHHVQHLNHSLGYILHEARAIKGAQHPLHRILEHGHRHRDGVADRLEQTLSHLATAAHRTLTDSHAGALREQLARLDSVLARLKGASGDAMVSGAGEIGQILSNMGSVASSAGGAPHIHSFKKLLDERRAQMSRIAGEARRSAGAVARRQGPLQQMPSTLVLGERQLQALRRHHPGLDKLLRNASQAHLGAELGKIERNALAQMFASGGRQAQFARAPAHAGGLGTMALGGAFQTMGPALAGFGGVRSGGAMAALAGAGGALNKAYKAPAGSPLQLLAKAAEGRGRQAAGRAQPPKSNVTAAALMEVFREHPRGKALAPHLAPGGALHALCETAQRGTGLPVGQSASHFLQSRGQHALLNSVSTFHSLVKDGNSPRFSLWGAIKGGISHSAGAVSRAVGTVGAAATMAASTVGRGIGSVAGAGVALRHRAVGGVYNVVQRGVGRAISHGAHGLWHAARGMGSAMWGGIKRGANTIGHVATQGINLYQSGTSWAGRRIGQGAHFVSDKLHKGIEWVNKTGVVGAVGGMLKKGVSQLGQAAKYTPLGYAISKGYGFVKSGGLSKVKNIAGKAWAVIKTAGKAVGGFLQSPAGQLLVTGLSLAATFIPGGLVVKTLIGAGIGAITAISEGKDWKGVLLAAGSGALTGALPFLKIGPLAKLGAGALSGAVSAVASGGDWKDALKGAAGGALDNFSPGALKALGKVKSISTAGKLLGGGKLSKAERAFMEGSKAAGPLRGLEKLMTRPGVQRAMGGLEKASSKTVKGGIWVSGKGAQAQNALDKAVSIGGKVHGALEQVHQYAPDLAGMLGDNAAGQFVGQLGDWAGKGDDKLSQALEYGQTASDQLSMYRGYLDKGLGVAGVKDPAKAYEKMMARKDLARGRKGGLEHVAQLKLEQRRRDHPELHDHPGHGRSVRRPMSRLELAIARGRELQTKGVRIASGVNTRLGKIHDVVEKGLGAADNVQGGLERASELAKQGAGILGEDTELGKFLSRAADRADQVHGYLEQGIGLAEDFNSKVDKVHGAIGEIPGVHDLPDENGKGRKHGKGEYESPLERATHLEGKHGRKIAPDGKKHGELIGRAESGLEAIEKFKRRAIKTGRKVDGRLTKVEQALGRGIRIGKKVDSGLEQVARLADQVSSVFGEGSALGDFAHQIGDTAGAGHEKLHGALDTASKGRSALHKGHDLFHRALELAQGHHEKEHEKKHGMEGRHTHHDDGGLHHGGLVHDGGPAPGGGGSSEEEIASVVQGAAGLVASFGEAAQSATEDIEALMQEGKTKEAGDRVAAVTATSERARLELTRAVSASHEYPALAKQAAEARTRYLEIRGHFFKFVSTLHGLGGQAQELEGIDGKKSLGGPQPQLGDKNVAEGDAETGRHGKKHHDPAGDLLDGLGEDGRIFVDRGGARGDMDVYDGQEIDPAAMDTWIGSGEGIKAFSAVFGAFIPAEGALVHGAGGGGNGKRPHHGMGRLSGDGRGAMGDHAKGFFHGLFEHLHGFADRVGGIARWGAGILGQGMHYAEMGMHGLSQIGNAAQDVQGVAGKAEGFLDKLGFGKLAGFAGGIDGAAGRVGEECELLRGGLKTADRWMGKGKKIAGQAEQGAGMASGLFEKAEHGGLVNLFKKSRAGDGMGGKLSPEKMRLNSQFDEPRRLDVMTMSRMESFLGGSFAGVRIHTGPGAAEITRRFNAEAVTVKDHIFFAPGKFNPSDFEGQKLLAHELTHVMQRGRRNMDVRTAESEAIRSERAYGSPSMETLNLSHPQADFRLADGEGLAKSDGVYTAKRNRSRGHEAGGKDTLPDGEEFLEQISGRVYELLMEELEQSFESR